MAENPPSRPPACAPVATALWSGALAGAAAAAIDALSTWSRLGQFLPGLGGRLRGLLHLMGLYAFFAAIVAVFGAASIVLLLRHTRLGDLLRTARLRYRRRRGTAADLAPLCLVLAATLCLGGALAGAYAFGLHTILHRHHRGLIIIVTIAATIGFSLAGLLAAYVVARPLEWVLGRVVGGRLRRWLSHWSAPLWAVALLLGAAGAVTAGLAAETLSQLKLRPLAVAAGAAILLGPAWLAVRRMERPLPWRARVGARAGMLLAALVVALTAGASPGVRKAAAAFSGLGGPLARVIRWTADLDRDGYAAVLGGGDCDDWDSAVHPGQREIPDDGIDQNCLGGDVRISRQPKDLRFVALPSGVPSDANVLLISVDTVRADHASAYGYHRATTPILDGLARQGALFVNTWAHAPSTRYSIPAMITGRYPSQVKWDNSVWWPALQLENLTLAEVMKSGGLTTGAILNYRYFDPIRRMNQGFDHYDNSNARLHQGRDPASTRGSSSRQQADAAIRYLERVAGRRFFLWVHFYDPHYQFERHPGTISFGNDPQALYDHEIRFTEEQIARVLQRLRELNLYDRTIIVWTSDHGEGFGERGIRFHGYHLYPPQTKVPLVIRVPGLRPRRITMPVGHIDLMPTLANLVGAKPDTRMQGRSLVAELAGTSSGDEDRAVFQEVTYEGPTERRALVTKRWQLVYNKIPDNTFELYDLTKHPNTGPDLWGTVEVDALKEQLLGWVDSLSIDLDSAAQRGSAVKGERPDPATKVEATFADGIRLLGLDGVPGRALRPGAKLELTWYLQCLDEPGEDWKVFVHVEGPSRFLGDHVPVGGALPTKAWEEGQFIADRHAVYVPAGAPAGRYTIWFGFFAGPRRLAVTDPAGGHDGSDRIRAATFEVR